MKKIILGLLVILVFSLVACSKENTRLEKVLEKGELVIITSPDYAPFEFIDPSKTGDDKYIGADIELMKYIAKELGVSLKLEVADFNTTLASLALGTVDLAISGYTYEDERAENYELSIPYYNEGKQGVLVLKENYENLNTKEKLNTNIKIGAQAGSMQADYVSQLENAKLENFLAIPDGITALDSKIISGISISKKVANIIMEKHPQKYEFVEGVFEVDEESTAMYVIAKKNETLLIEKINEIIEKVVAEGLYSIWDEEATIKAIELGLL